MRQVLVVSSILFLAACSADPGSEEWCAAKKEQSKSEWTGSDAATYARHCIIDGLEVGSDGWCEDLAGKPKGEWTADEAASYAKHCVM
jgi:hypothetical protein